MTKAHRPFHPRCPTRSRARVRLSLCVLIMGANLELMTSASSAATSPAAPVEMTTAVSDFFYHSDDLDNIMAITDAAGSVVEHYEYLDYGQPEFFDASDIGIPQSAIANPYLFTARRYDPETGWYYHRDRYLDPIAGRFVTRLAANIIGYDRYLGSAFVYSENSPWGGGPGLYGEWLAEGGAGGETQCNIVTGKMETTINNKKCDKECTEAHEKDHRDYRQDCCKKASEKRKSCGTRKRCKGQVASDWNEWVRKTSNFSECRAHGKGLECRAKLYKEKDCCDLPEDATKKEKLCCKQIKRAMDRDKKIRKRVCKKAKDVACPF